ncbi:DUF3732 domain-containing protein [Caballeronia sp. LjRoot31]|uniref:DUF3732 domain-containing protein n=1 Tax=Caballeronia sp. LjRoot31 TaxID=3342324 RepID=UPI003F4FFDE5
MRHIFEKERRPVPGLLILDRIIQPYFPNRTAQTTVEPGCKSHKDAEYDDGEDDKDKPDVVSSSADDGDFQGRPQM